MDKHSTVLNKKIIILEDILVITAIIIMLSLTAIASFTPNIETWLRVVLLIIGCLPLFIFCFIAVALESMVGFYKCDCCGHENYPSIFITLMVPHVGRTRYIRCEKCNKKSWQKKII
jgi:DNA-directed RNA polymerase subunit RPC12/RpoP